MDSFLTQLAYDLRNYSFYPYGGAPTRADVRRLQSKFRVASVHLDRLVHLWNGRLNWRGDIGMAEALILSAMSNADNDALCAIADLERSQHVFGLRGPERPWHCSTNGVLLRTSLKVAYERWADNNTNGQVREYYEFDDCNANVTEDGDVVHESYTWYCSHCDGYHHTEADDEVEVVTSMRVTFVINTRFECERGDHFWCDASERYYDSDEFTRAVMTNGDNVCEEWADNEGWFCNNSGHWSEDDESTQIPQYHKADRSATHYILRKMESDPEPVTLQTRYFGVEVEVEFGSSSDRQEWFDEAEFDGHIAERDGSLSESRGLEIISKPMQYADWHQSSNSFLSLLRSAREAGAKGWEVRHGYGIHVNVDLRGITDEQIFLYYTSVNNMAEFYIFLSGRKPYNGDYCKRTKPPIHRVSTSSKWDWYNQRYPVNQAHRYQPVRVNQSNQDRPMCEVRTFGSNLREGALLEFIELCSAHLDWVVAITNTPRVDGEYPEDIIFAKNSHHALYDWVVDHVNDYPRLNRFFSRLGTGSILVDEEAFNTMSR